MRDVNLCMFRKYSWVVIEKVNLEITSIQKCQNQSIAVCPSNWRNSHVSREMRC